MRPGGYPTHSHNLWGNLRAQPGGQLFVRDQEDYWVSWTAICEEGQVVCLFVITPTEDHLVPHVYRRNQVRGTHGADEYPFASMDATTNKCVREESFTLVHALRL
jgi:hypothetical protein